MDCFQNTKNSLTFYVIRTGGRLELSNFLVVYFTVFNCKITFFGKRENSTKTKVNSLNFFKLIESQRILPN